MPPGLKALEKARKIEELAHNPREEAGRRVVTWSISPHPMPRTFS